MTRADQKALLSSFIAQAQEAGLKVRWHDPTIIVIGLPPEAPADDSTFRDSAPAEVVSTPQHPAQSEQPMT